MKQFLAPTAPARADRSSRAADDEESDNYLVAIAAQSDPAKLATLGSRQANPRLKRIIYWLAAARDAGGDRGGVIDQVQKQNGRYFAGRDGTFSDRDNYLRNGERNFAVQNRKVISTSRR